MDKQEIARYLKTMDSAYEVTNVSEDYGQTSDDIQEATLMATCKLTGLEIVFQLHKGRFDYQMGCQYWVNDEHMAEVEDGNFDNALEACEAYVREAVK